MENKLLIRSRDQDCSDNRFMNFLIEYLNNTGVSGDKRIFYGQATSFSEEYSVNNVLYYRIYLKEYKKNRDFITAEKKYIEISGEMGNIILRLHKVKELERTIKINKV